MASTFRRSGASQQKKTNLLLGLQGTRPWTGGITITSTGLKDLDVILSSSGQPLGTCLYLEEDRWTDRLALCLVQYWLAEGVSQGQLLVIPTDADAAESLDRPTWADDNEDYTMRTLKKHMIQLLHSLPRNLHWDKRDAGAINTTTLPSDSLATLDEGVVDDEKADDDLKIAWQYKKSVQQERLGIAAGVVKNVVAANQFCHSYDLNGRLSDQVDVLQNADLSSFSCCQVSRTVTCGGRVCGYSYFRQLMAHLRAKCSSNAGNVVRLLLFRLNPSTLQVSLPLLLAQIRHDRLPVIVLIVMQPWTSKISLDSIRRTSDVVMTVEGFAGREAYPPPPEFKIFQGLLKIHRINTWTAATALGGGHFADVTVTKRQAADLFGLRRDRRKLHIQLLHIPPEDFAAGGGRVGGGVRTGAGQRTNESKKVTSLGCSSAGGNSMLDF